jgi:hypothetical protein
MPDFNKYSCTFGLMPKVEFSTLTGPWRAITPYPNTRVQHSALATESASSPSGRIRAMTITSALSSRRPRTALEFSSKPSSPASPTTPWPASRYPCLRGLKLGLHIDSEGEANIEDGVIGKKLKKRRILGLVAKNF